MEVFLLKYGYHQHWCVSVRYSERYSEGVWTLKLAGNCDLDYHANIHALALACPGVDYLRLWPLPVEQPWQETPDPLPDWVPGGYAWR